MYQFGGKDSKRHFTIVSGGKEHGLYISSTPSSAAKKAVTKLCTANKSKKVEFHIREITQGSKKKTYGPYLGHIEKLKEPIELKGRVIKYKPVAKLIGKVSAKKGGMFRRSQGEGPAEIKIKCIHDRNNEGGTETTLLRLEPDENKWAINYERKPISLEKGEEVQIILRDKRKNDKGEEYFYVIKKSNKAPGLVKAKYIKCSNPGIKCIHDRNNEGGINTTMLRLFPDEDKWAMYDGKPIFLEKGEEVIVTATNIKKNPQREEYFYVIKKNNKAAGGLVKARYIICSNSRVEIPNINNSLLDSPKKSTNLRSLFQTSYGQSAILPGLRGQSANSSGFPGQSAILPGLRGQSANSSGFHGQSAILPGLRGQSANSSGLGYPTSLSGFPEQPNRSTEKLYNCVDNLELFKSIGGHIIPNFSIPKGQVVEVLETQKHFGDEYKKIRVTTIQGNIEGFVLSNNLKKTRWCCNHETCLRFNGPYDANQNSNRSIPKSVAVILRNSQGHILVGTETDSRKTTKLDPTIPGYHLLAGKIDPGSCPVYSCYDETAEEGRFLPVENKGRRDFKRWDSIFKPGGSYRMQPWLSTGRAIVFVGEIKIGDPIWDASNPPYGNPQQFTNPEELTAIFSNLSSQQVAHKYKEKVNFKWVTPLPFGSTDQQWQNWSSENQMYQWGSQIIQDYVEKSSQPAQLQPRQPTFSHGMAALSEHPGQNLSSLTDRLYTEVLADQQSTGGRIEKVSNDKYILHISDNYRKIIEREFLNNKRNFHVITFYYETGPISKNEGYFDMQILKLIESRMKTSETNLEDLLELCRVTYYGMFQKHIPLKKLNELKQYIMTNPIKERGPNPTFFKQ
jgi:hypothetical protein